LQDFAAFIEQLKEKNDIETVVGGYVKLERKGGKLWGRCPFHNEKTPSFTVNGEGQFYHCFGCGAGGDVIRFIQEIESLQFMDAVKFLCEKSGMEMPQISGGRGEQSAKEAREKRDRLYAALKDAARYYHNCLNEKGAEIIKYLMGRGISQEYIKKFGLGYCPDEKGLAENLIKKGHSVSDIKAAGLSKEDENGRMYDPLNGRLIIPIINSMGDVIAFGGRDMKGTSLAKYKNTAETEVFSKSKNLYAINIVKKNKSGKGKGIIVVEGYMDAIALHQAGFGTTVASMGTSLTKEQAKLIKRFSDEAYICYDGDSAGQAATLRGLDILKNAGISVKVISMPEGTDPDEYVKARGKESFEKLIAEAPPLADFKLNVLQSKYDLNNPDGRRRYAQAAIGVISEEENEVTKEELLKQLRNITGLTYESLKRDLETAGGKTSVAPSPQTSIQTAPMGVKAARFILYCLLHNKPYAKLQDLPEEHISDSSHFRILDYIKECRAKGKEIRISALFEGEFQQEYEAVLICGEGMSEEEAQKYYSDCVKYFSAAKYENELKILTCQFETEKDINKRKELVLKIQALTQKQKKNL
jgi:DNA primase